ncbi:hypothetical protein LCGC14_0873370 [marine sediment metagenome]|uniref:Uncharacterized protein n=1 Tax=marine sediment metagenome TaxID=412755 RepID=A0A0F9P8Y7_9ZZZZ
MKLIKGEDLNQQQTRQVLNVFIYRWTTDNAERERVWANIKRQPTIPLVSDNQWFRDHAFWFVNSGMRLAANRKHVEPVYMAND